MIMIPRGENSTANGTHNPYTNNNNNNGNENN